MAGPRRGKRDDGASAKARAFSSSRRASTTISPMRCSPARRKALKEAGAAFDCISVPGSLEIPTAIAIALDAAETPPPRL